MGQILLGKKQILEDIVASSGFDISKVSMDELHEIARLTEVIDECQQLVAIYTSPDQPTKPFVDHLKKRLVSFGIDESSMYVQDYIDRNGVAQQNLAVELTRGGKGRETVVISGHMDTVSPKEDIFSLTPEGDRPYVGRTEIKKNPKGDLSVYGFGMCDMKNLFGIMLQIAKESHHIRQYTRNPDVFVEERIWLKGINQDVWEVYKSWLQKSLSEGSLKDPLAESKNRLLLVATSGEEAAGHEGAKKAIESDLGGVVNSDLWVIPEPSSGLVDTHKGYAATQIRISSESTPINGINYNPNEQALILIERLRKKHLGKEFVKPHYQSDGRLGLPTHNVGIVKGFMDDNLSDNYFEINFNGAGGHSSNPPENGNPIECAASFYNTLKTMYGNDISLVVLDGGTSRNAVPLNVKLGIRVKKESYNIELFRRMFDFSYLALREYSQCSIGFGVSKDEGLENLSPINMPQKVKLSFVKLSRSRKAKNLAIVENDYRLVPGQVPEDLGESVKYALKELGFSGEVTLTRDSYPLASRYSSLDGDLQERLWAIGEKVNGKATCEGVPFSTEAGTIALLLKNPIPLLLSATCIDQAHKQDEEYVTLNELRRQMGIFNDLLPAMLGFKIKSSYGGKSVTASQTDLFIQNIVRKGDRANSELEFREHLEWFREREIFAALQVGKGYFSNPDELKKLERCISDFSRFLGLYPVLLLDAGEGEVQARISQQSFGYEIIRSRGGADAGFKTLATEAIRRGKVPIALNNSGNMFEFAEAVVKALNPLKYIILDRGIYDQNGNIISRLDFNKMLFDARYERIPSYEEFLGRLRTGEIKGDMYRILYQCFNHLTSFPDEKAAKIRSVQITSLDSLMEELFTVAGRGTLLRWGYNVDGLGSFDGVDLERLKELLEATYRNRLNDDYISRTTPNVKMVLVERDYDGAVILTSPSQDHLLGNGILCIDKIGLRSDYWRQDLPERLMEEVLATSGLIYWREFEGSPVRDWSRRLVDFARRQGKFASQESLVHEGGRRMEVYTIGLNPLSTYQGGIKTGINLEAFSRPSSFSK